MLEAAETLLEASPDAQISTRAVCDAVGVGAPVLYRIFGDKAGLLRAVVDHGFERYLAGKRAARPSADPVDDLRSGWDSHVAFALAHPTVYRLMFSPELPAVPQSAAEALQILRTVVDRCAAAGRLGVEPESAARMIMSANIGVALSLVSQPGIYADSDLSDLVRDAVHAKVLVPSGQAPADGVASIALQLSARLREVSGAPLAPPELELLQFWLLRLADA